MRVLDIDLDFFLKSRVEFPTDPHGRLDGNYHQPWVEDRVVEFMELHCGLSTSNPIAGRSFVEHVEVFYWWRGLIDSGRLTTPFDVVHVDAHSDLGCFDPSWLYIFCELLNQPAKERRTPRAGCGGMTSANFLAYACACEWVSQIFYVVHPELRCCVEGPDIALPYLPGHTFEDSVLSFRPCHSEAMAMCSIEDWRESNPHRMELRVPISFPTAQQLDLDGQFDYLSVVQSPAFTPPQADSLLPVLQAYIRPI